ncbi:MAG: hypothetical protein JSR21_17070 [Proteobacteria bacterium]|nr:hypothetical protein [Pseudomonadota bacterium]
MSRGEVLYLLLVVGSFGLFMVALAYYTARYSPRPRTIPSGSAGAVAHEDHATAH